MLRHTFKIYQETSLGKGEPSSDKSNLAGNALILTFF